MSELILNTLFEYKDIILLIGTVSFGTLFARILVKTMTLPIVRDVLGKGAEWLGAWVSWWLTKIFQGDAQSIEDEFEDLFDAILWKRFKKGLNKDDT